MYAERLRPLLDTFEKDFKRKHAQLTAGVYASAQVDDIRELCTPLDKSVVALGPRAVKLYRLFESVLVLMAVTHKRMKYQQVS